MGLATRSLDEELVRAEICRIYMASAWVGPVGAGGLALLVTALLWNDMDRSTLVAWFGVQVIVQVVVVLSLTVATPGRWVAPNGLSRVAQIAHLETGVAFGLLLWLDPAMVARADLRWFAVMVMFALTAGVLGGLSGVPALGLIVIVPLWSLGSAALLVGGEWVTGAGGLLYLIIQLVDQRRTAGLWRELITLRLHEQRRADEHAWLASHDAMTGLLNRSGILAHMTAHPSLSTTMFIDLDRFKAVNDQYGHPAGDQVLVEVGRRLRTVVRASDAVGRLGGDEFFIVFDRVLTEAEAAELGERIIGLIERPVETAAGLATVSASVGATISGADRLRSDPANLIAEADSALLEAKRNGRHQVVVNLPAHVLGGRAGREAPSDEGLPERADNSKTDASSVQTCRYST